MKLATALTLGRSSNLPTVWSNALAGMAFASVSFTATTPSIALLAAVLFAFSLLYLGGMFFNDAFDAEWDKAHQQNRPIVNGETSVKEVSSFATLFFIVALAIFAGTTPYEKRAVALTAASLLILCILLYDWKHKQWSFSAWVMGSCRCMLYITAALLVGTLNGTLFAAGICLTAYIAGITYLARSEHLNHVSSFIPLVLLAAPLVFALYITYSIAFPAGYAYWPALMAISIAAAWLIYSIRFLLPGPQRFIPKAIGGLLAGLCLIDSSLLFALGYFFTASVALACFGLCLILQHNIKAS